VEKQAQLATSEATSDVLAADLESAAERAVVLEQELVEAKAIYAEAAKLSVGFSEQVHLSCLF
jgi:hypothetical protein